MRHLKENSTRWVTFFAAFFAATQFTASIVQASIIVPTGLNPGDTYHLAFVSSTSRDGTSTNIADYNSFVQGVANAAGIGSSENVDWFTIASTSTVDAKDNAVVGVSTPVYLVNGTTKIADGFSDMWDGSLDASPNRSKLKSARLRRRSVRNCASRLFSLALSATHPLAASVTRGESRRC